MLEYTGWHADLRDKKSVIWDNQGPIIKDPGILFNSQKISYLTFTELSFIKNIHTVSVFQTIRRFQISTISR